MFFSLRNRLFLIFTGLLTVPFVILSIVVPSWFMTVIKNQTEDLTFEMLEQYALYVDSVTTQAEDLGKQILINQTTQDWLRAERDSGSDDSDTRLLRNELRALLTSIIINNSHGMSVTVVLEDGKGIWVEHESEEIEWLQEGIRKDMFIGYHYDVDQPGLEMRDEPMNSYILPLFDLHTFITSGVIKVNFPTRLLEDAIQQVRIGENGQAYLVNTKGESLLPTDRRHPKHMTPNIMTQLNQSNARQGLVEVEREGDEVFLFFKKLPVEDWVLISEVKESDLFKEVNQLQKNLFIVSALLFIVTIVASYLLSSTIVSPLGKLAGAMKFIEKGDFIGAQKYMPTIQTKNNEVAYLIDVFDHTVNELKRLIDTEYEANIRRKGAEYKALLLQINPHFMNNTLEIIGGLAAQGKNEEVINVSSYLGKMMRYSLDTKSIVVTLGEEMNYIRSYTKILMLRYEEQLLVIMDEDPHTKDVPVLRFILQPLVENAVKYSFVEKDHAEIFIGTKRHKNKLLITVEDKGSGMKQELVDAMSQLERGHQSVSVLETKGQSIGLRNVLERLKLYYGQHFAYEIASEEGKGTKITLEITLTRGDRDERFTR
ncbi:hypothetical protein AJ85_02345 [Alkalihalobacillus alcalophilus ATCC 27647 = CGMCC 1.3604]|uniref:histidine kinase n=1 Tax=Alkalihalobacillus alcalophilus ATCC 27647 = CGMCC 1.3604 TaxID=1218173 RepID=A0A094WE22_ALKAL|nr:sensor histidine kinase [Alkalihalobacillus alcalophilus]KGA96004.1 histidine kinase [Alkalihalobacillus alcalophilus ATCC 27647 = CGMCC 1.3604]MED1562478.1 histidine kinase [Alkalihalobacillus alcalophilus]THG88565.1 hypothetical protein AJ85_02345 [Alkalihalobacillus alcalophilus ATCC 27647 = CGMCC 1.3604]